MIRRILPILFVLAVAFVFEACSGKTTASTPPDTSAGLQYSLSIGPIMAMPGEENTQCIIVHLGNMSSIHVGQIHDVLTPGSHHMIVYRSSETVEQTTPVDCVPFTDTLDPTKGSTLVVTQKKDDTLTLPQGVAFTLDPQQMIRIELHYINTGSTPLEITGTTNFVTMADSQYKDEAGFLFIGDPDITLPPHAQTTLGPVFFSMPIQYQGVNFFAITGHEHQMGTGVNVWTASSATDPGTSVYDVPGWLWSEPTTVQATPPFVLPDQGGFKFTCTWDNTSDSTINFGESALDEMCFFWAYYYPSQGSQVCIHSDRVGMGGVDVCCPGASFVCSEIIQYLDSDGGASFGSFGGGQHDSGAGATAPSDAAASGD
jgi:hypothetical protein